VKQEKADVGLAFDGDGDRAVLIDEKGRVLSGTVMTAMLADFFLKDNAGATVLYNATCGWIVPETIKKRGGKAIRTRVGHSFIKSDMRKYNALFAGESSGHYYFKDNYMADSGLIAAAVGLYLLSLSNKPLSVLADDYRKYVQIPETNMIVQNKEIILKNIEQEFKDSDLNWLDGLTVQLPEVWFNVRPSNTEPILRLNAEAKNQITLDATVQKVTSIIKSVT